MGESGGTGSSVFFQRAEYAERAWSEYDQGKRVSADGTHLLPELGQGDGTASGGTV